jgi:CRISPR system Cascade subunit CasA
MNLTTDKWIPVVWNDGRRDPVSLNDAFEHGSEIHDLSVRPHERIALMRLLICIAQAALDGPKDRNDWRTCGARLPQAALDYLKKWQKVFELFGDGPRFSQAKGTGEPGSAELAKLDFIDKDMTTLFDPTASPCKRESEDWIATHLLVYQCFAAGGQVGGSIKSKPQTGKNAPCRDSSAFHALIRKVDLLSAIQANLVTQEQIARTSLVWGKPTWEYQSTDIRDFMKDADLPRSYMGRLVPISRAIWLDDGRCFAMHANGVEYHNFNDHKVRDTTTAVRAKDDEYALVGAGVGDSVKHPWRELHALVLKGAAQNGVGGPLVLQNLDNASAFDLWVGAVVTSKAKIEDLVESVFTQLPAKLLDPTVQQAYENGVKLANGVELRLRRAIATYRLAMETSEPDADRIRVRYTKLKKSERERLGDIAEKAQSAFWTLAETQLNLLLRFAMDDMPLKDGKVQPHATDWGKALWVSVRSAYETACGKETPRQFRAYAIGLNELLGEPEQNGEAIS